MADWRERLQQVKERYQALGTRAKVGLLAGAGVLVAVLVLVAAHGSEPSYAVLFSNLAQDDAARIVERLGAMNVDYQLEDGGTTIRVPEGSVHETRLTLANEGLPNGGGVGFELFDTQRFGESDFSEQVQFRRALEGELARTISHLAGVQRARVHLVLPERTLFASEEREASASVALHLNPGWQIREEQVQGVAHLVASSVPGLSPENVTVVDGNGRPLEHGGGGEEAVATDAEELRRQIERGRQRAVQQLLDASLGPGAAVVRVSADVNMSREEHLQETYDPDRVATRSFEVTEERSDDAEAGAQGVPGAASNLPGGEGAEEQGGQAADLARRHERRNFEVTKTVRRAVHPVGRISRLTVAVVVDGHWTGEGDARTFEPRDDEELARIRSLVTTAAGIDEGRGDAISVECVPFADSETPMARVELDPLARWEPYLPWAAAALGVLLVLVVVLVVWWRRRKRVKADEEEARALGSGDAAAELPEPRDVDLDAEEEVELEDPREMMADYEQLRVLALEVARRDPELAARVVRGWLAEDGVSATDEAETEKEAA
ncbi:MAG TPA: flagellar basal-body MS-ring/collar protein FliF [Sandaracinaceae bacterium LLY-WYZ-13_1]|nr:flagellar basal-body MS-ring/collar protein FliF [Sandaracinaceae bacterium LLY-WYZ-13_1]